MIPEPPITMARGRLDALTGIRGVAALIVVGFHMHLLTLWPGTLLMRGYVGVELFFVLSGFILSFVYDRAFASGAATWPRFIALRLGRIYPAYFVVFLLCLLMQAAIELLHLPHGEASDYGLAAFAVAYALMVQSWGLFAEHDFNGPAWSISAEWLCYLAFPLLLRLTRPVRGVVPVLGVIALCLVLYFFIGRDGGLIFSAKVFTPRVVMCFVIGMMLWRLTTFELGANRALGWITDAAAVALTALVLANPTHELAAPLIVVLIAVLLFGLSYGRGGTAWLLSRPAMLYLGEISYSIYLLHWLVLLTTMRLWNFIPPQWTGRNHLAASLVAVALSLLLAALLYHLVERPARAWVRDRVDRWKRPAGGVDQARPAMVRDASP